MKRIPLDKQHQPITLKGGDEFSELAGAFNDMSRQLHEEETLRSEFIATLSHEIRTPLSSIHESVNMIVEEVFGTINCSIDVRFGNLSSGICLNHWLKIQELSFGTITQQTTAAGVEPATVVNYYM